MWTLIFFATTHIISTHNLDRIYRRVYLNAAFHSIFFPSNHLFHLLDSWLSSLDQTCQRTKCSNNQGRTHHDVSTLHGHAERRVVGGEALGAADERGGRGRGEGVGRDGESGNEGESGLHLGGYFCTGGAKMSWWRFDVGIVRQ